METALKIVSIIAVILGVLAILQSGQDQSFYGLIGGMLFLVEGVLALMYISEKKINK